jgi:hypothetical protein
LDFGCYSYTVFGVFGFTEACHAFYQISSP